MVVTRLLRMRLVANSTLLLAASGSLACTAVSQRADPTTETARPPAGSAPSTPEARPPASDETDPHRFVVAASREGPLEIVRWGERPIVLLDGEPVPIDDTGRPQREANAQVGLLPRYGMDAFDVSVVAYGEAPDGEAWVVTRLEPDRAADVLDVYQRTGDRWHRRTVEKTWLTEYYAAFVSRDGALLGLRAYAPSQRVVSYWEDHEQAPAELTRALESARPGFVRLAGSSTVDLPELPESSTVRPFTAIATEDGSIHALASTPDDAVAIVTWTPGARQPRTSTLPELVGRASLSSQGDEVLVGGRDPTGRPRLVVGRAGSWEVVPMAEAMPRVGISSAAREPDGGLWVVLGHHNRGGTSHHDTLWTRSLEGEWSRVSLPVPDPTSDDEGLRWAWDADELGWTSRERRRIEPDTVAAANRIVWARNALWIVADLGPLWTDDEGYAAMAIRRSALYTTAAVATPVRLEPVDLNRVAMLAADDRSSAEPGEQGCRSFTMVLGDEDRARALTPDDLEAIEAASSDLAVVPLELYLGDEGSSRVLALAARGYDPKAARRFIDAVGSALGSGKPPVDCRPRRLVEMIQDFE